MFEYAKPSESYLQGVVSQFIQPMLGTAYVLNTVSWIFDVFIVVGIVATGLAADAGHAWAAGNRAYRSIPTQG